MLKIVLTVTLDYIMTMHKFMEKLRHNDLSKSHACETGSMRAQWGYTGGISLVSPFSLTSCPVAAVHWRCYLKRVWQGDIQVSKAWGGETAAVQLRNFRNSSSPASLQQKIGQHGVFFLHLKKGSSTVLFLFSQVSSCISASHLRFQPSHMIVCFVKAYEHCHLVVISKAPNYNNLHLEERLIIVHKHGGLRKCHSVITFF